MIVFNLEKPIGALCTELHEKSKYCSRNSRYPKTNPPPEDKLRFIEHFCSKFVIGINEVVTLTIEKTNYFKG